MSELKALSCPSHCMGGYKGMDSCGTCGGVGSVLRVKDRVLPNTKAGYKEALTLMGRIAYDFIQYSYDDPSYLMGPELHDFPPDDDRPYTHVIIHKKEYDAAMADGRLRDIRHTGRATPEVVDNRKAPGS